MISVREIHKAFGRVRAVRGVSFEIESGQVTGLLGPNGAGKSTTIRMMTAFLPPDKGSISVCGLDTQDDSLEVRRRIGYLPEDAPSYPEMSVSGYLAFRARLYGLRGRARREGVERAMDRCAIRSVRRRRIGHLSKGYRQRVGLAAAIVHEPSVVILDEPTNGLDPAQIREVRALVRELCADRAVLVSSHILAEVERTCDRVIIIARGRVCADGAPEALLGPLAEEAVHRIACEWMEGEALRELEIALRTIPGVAGVEWSADEEGDQTRLEVRPARGAGDLGASIGRLLRDRRVAVHELVRRPPTLESLFLQRVEGEDER